MNVIKVPCKQGPKARKIIAVAVWELVMQSYDLPDGNCVLLSISSARDAFPG